MKRVLTSEHVLANVASMSRAARSGLTVAIVYGGAAGQLTTTVGEAKCWPLPLRTTRAVAEKTRDLLHERGWTNVGVPDSEGTSCICVALPQPPGLASLNSGIKSRSDCSAIVSDVISAAIRRDSPVFNTDDKSQSIVLEHFDGFVDSIENGVALVTLKSREHGDELLGQYPAAQLTEQGIYEQSRFLCRTVQEGQATRVEIEAIPKVVPTEQQIREIENELNRMLPPDDNVDY